MVDGPHGDLDHVVRHVVMEYRTTLECVTIPNLHVEGNNVKATVLLPFGVTVLLTLAVQVMNTTNYVISRLTIVSREAK